MKKLFMTFAAMLLMSVGAFAQSSETPLKGDVNEDGVVDVADINAIIAIMKNGGGTSESTKYYWYVGYNQDAYEHPEGFKSNMYTTTINSMPTEYSKTGDNGLNVATTGTTPNYLVMIIPSSWPKPVIYGQFKDGEIIMTLEKKNISITGINGVTFNVYSGTGEISDSEVFIN